MARTEPASAQPLHGGEGAGTITIDVAAKLLMVTGMVRRLTKDGWIAKTDRGRYRVVDVVQSAPLWRLIPKISQTRPN